MPYTRGGMGPLYQHCPKWRRLSYPERTSRGVMDRHQIKPVSDWRFEHGRSRDYPARCWVRDWECSCGHRWTSNYDWQKKYLEEFSKKYPKDEK